MYKLARNTRIINELTQVLNKADYASHGIDGRIRPRQRELWYLDEFREIRDRIEKLVLQLEKSQK